MTFGFLSHPLGLLVLLRMLFANGNGRGGAYAESSAPGVPAVPTGPFPVAKPATLPAWPKGWCPDVPVPPEVRARAWALLPELWKGGEGTRKVEMVGGRYITFVAAMVAAPDPSKPGQMVQQKAVGAFRSVNCEQVYPEGVSTEQAADAAAKALANSAVVMNEALKLRGYKKSDQVIYKDFQGRAGLNADGYPGTTTMVKLELVLKGAGQQMAPVRVYPWRATGAYDGVNAPTQAEWDGTAVPATSPVARPAGKPAPSGAPPQPAPPPIVPAVYTIPKAPSYVPPSPAYVPASMSNVDVQHALNVLGYKGADGVPLKEDGIIGPQSKFATAGFQRDHPPLAVDGVAGPQTKSALGAAIALQKVALPSTMSLVPVAPVIVSSPVDVQRALNRLHYLGADGRPLVEDGKLGANSQYATRAFQREHPPLAQDGIAGPQTKAALSTSLLSVAV